MAWFKKKPDPITDRARALNDQIAELESEIKKLDDKLQRNPPPPRLRSTALPYGATVSHPPTPAPAPAPQPAKPAPQEPIFEEVDQKLLDAQNESLTTPDHYNDLGVRKYDLVALLRRIQNHFRGPSATNPKLVSYLAAGGIQGLRPLRYEKRVARNRTIVAIAILFFMLLGIVLTFVHRR